MIKLKVDDIDYLYQKKEKNTYTETIFQYCYNKGITIPCFCYHEKLSIAGNCRMCIVQINNGLGVSCAVNLIDSIIIYTDNKRVKEARESILEFLLINHPLDCPIRDQGSECDLQDISLIFGSDRGRFYEQKKRAVDNFNQKGPLIKTVMTRCIHRTRCVRFSNEISNFMLGVISRGLKMEIGTYVNENENISLLDVLSGNIIDLCPVGASTSMPYAFKVRSWEIIYYSNIDFLDSLASSIRLHIYSNKIIRVLPLLDENLNEEWISNKTRFAYDSLLLNRISYPKIKYINKFIVFSWDFLINYILKWMKRKNNKFITGVLGPFIDLTTSLSLKNFFNIIGISSIFSYFKFKWFYDFKFFYLLNNSIESLEFFFFYLFIGCDLRLENPLLNIRIKKNYNINKNNELFFFSYGLSLINMNYPIKNLGNNILKFLRFLKGKVRIFSIFFFKSFFSFSFINLNIKLYNSPILICGQTLLMREDSLSFLYSFIYFFKKKFSWNAFNLIINNLGLLSFNTIIYNNITHSIKNIRNGLLYNISNDILSFFLKKYDFIIYQGFIKGNSNLFLNANIILPSTAPYEMDNLFINLEGRYRLMKKHIKNFSTIYADWEIINFLKVFNKKKDILNFSFFKKFNFISIFFLKLIDYFCNFFFVLDEFFINFFFFYGYKKKHIIELYNNDLEFSKNINYFFKNKFFNTLFYRIINNFYSSDFFLRNSKVMSLSAIKTYSTF